MADSKKDKFWEVLNGGSSGQQSGNTAPASTRETSFWDTLESKGKMSNQTVKISRKNVDDRYINSFINDANSFLKSMRSDYKWMGTYEGSSIYQAKKKTVEDLNSRSLQIKMYLAENRENMDEEGYNSLKSVLDNFSRDSTSSMYAFFEKQNDYDQKSKLDLSAAEQEIKDLKAKRYEYANNHQFDLNDLDQREEYDKSIAEMGDKIAQKEQYLNQARHIQESAKLSSVTGNSDFRSNSGYVSTYDDSAWSRLISTYGMGYQDLTYEYINNQNGIRDEIKQKHSVYDKNDDESRYEANGYDYLTENEVAIYNYYYAKEGKAKAEEYLDSIQEALNMRKATSMYEDMEGKTALELAFGFEAGLDQFRSGMVNAFNTEDDYIAQTAYQIASGMVREDLADNGAKLPDWLGGASLGQAGYDLITTSANMAPSILASISIGILNPAAGGYAGNALMGVSAAGNAYQEALNQGYSKGQARAYSTMIGASEAILGEMLGGISKLGGTSKAVTNMLNGVDNAFFRTAGKIGGSMLSEGLEEGLQEVLSPMFSNFFLNTDEKVNWSEVAYSALLGALTAGIMEGPTTISGEVGTYQTGKQLQAADISAQRLAEIGQTFSADTVAYQLAGRVNENTGAYTMGRLFNEIGATLTEQNVNDITNALVAKGMDSRIASKNAKALAYVVEGGKLSDRQIAMIEANDVLAEAARTTLVDANTTWNQRSKGYNEALMALAREKASPNASRTNPAQQGEDNAPASDKVDAENKKTAEGSSEADIPAAKVQSISTIKDGQVTVKMDDGSEVDIAESGIDPEDGMLIETIAKIGGISSEDANFILGTLKATPGVSAQVTSLGAKEAYQYGFYGFSQDHIAKHGVFANSLTESQRQAIYETGRKARAKQAAEKQATVSKKESVATVEESSQVDNRNNNRNATDAKKVGKVHFDGDRSELTNRQKASLTAMEKVADIMGVQIHVFESKVGANGKRIGANGWYDPDNNSIHIDLHAGANGEGTMLFTLSHELTHHIRKWSPEKFQILSDFLMEEYGKKGINVDALVREQQAKAKRKGRTISYDIAWGEVVADSMETMLADGNVLNRLEKLRARDESLWKEIKNFINDLTDKIRAAYKGMTADSVEGRMVADMRKAVYRLQELFADALYDASENYQASLTPGEEGVVVNQNGDPVAYSTEDGSVLLSMRTYEEEGREEFRKYLNKCVKSKKLTKAEMQEMLDGIEEIYGVCKEFKDKYAPFSSWSDAAVVRDTFGKPVFSVVTPNGDYKMNLDFSLVCKKRRTLDAVFNEMTKRGIIDDFELGQKSVVKINEIIRKYGLETACALCFVDAKRFRQASMADQFTTLYNELVMSLVPEDQRSSIDHFNFAGYATIKKVDGGIDTWEKSKLDFSHLDEVMKNYSDGTVEYKAAKYIKNHPEGRKLLLRVDFMSSQGFDAVKTQNQDILKLYNSKKGTGGPKAAFGDVQYMNEVIQKARWWTPKKAYAVGGVRIQSFSDYVPRMVFDYTQMIYDLAATKLPAHAYTKEALFVKQFGLTGVKINMSLIPAIAEGGIAPGLDANGDYVWEGESFDFETAKEIQNAEGYTENCGTICVGVSKQHILKLLSDPDIRMVIPYHKSGLNPIVAHMNKIAEFTDYTTLKTNPGGCQNTIDNNGSKVEVDFNFNEVLRKTGDPKATVRQYLDWCAKNEYTPRFAEFAWHENYYKLIEDFTLYDKDGKYVPQREVRAVFPKDDSAFGSMKDLIREGLEEDAVVEGKRDKSLSAIVDEIQKTLPKTEAEIEETQVAQADRDLEAEVQLSDRDYAYDSLVSKPDMAVTLVEDNAPKNRADVIAQAKKNAAKVGKFNPKDGSVSVHVNDIDRDVVLGTAGLKHSLDRRMDVNASITLMAGEILQNSIKINELTPQKAEADESYVLIGAARNSDGELFVVRSVVNRFSNELASMDVLYAINAKKENRLRSMRPGFQGPVTDSNISIADLLDHVNQYFPEVLPEDVLKYYGHDARPEGKLGESALYSDRDTESVSNRSLLANAFEGVAQNDIERNKIQEYKGKISLIESEERKLRELNEKIKELSFAKGPKDTKAIRDLQFEANQAANRINTYDKQLLRLEASKPLQAVLEREKKTAYKKAEKKGKDALEAYRERAAKTQRELMDRYENSRKWAKENREKTAMRHKIKDVVNDLNQYLLKGTKDRHVPIGLQKAVAEALNAVNMDTVGAEERIAKLEAELMKAKTPEQIREISKKIEHIREMGDNMSSKLKRLKEAYDDFLNSDDPMIANSHDDGLSAHMMTLIVRVGDTPLRDMSLSQLQDVYDVYKIVLATVRNANKSFKDSKNREISTRANQVMAEIDSLGNKRWRLPSFMNWVEEFGWNNLKPVYAMEHIGSQGLIDAFNNVRSGEDVWAKDVTEAREYYLEKSKKYRYDSWDFEKKHRFTSTTEKKFELTLDQIMSLYAYSKREQAADHLRYGGIVFDPKTEVVEKTKSGIKVKYNVADATSYNISAETLAEIISKLTPEQKSFVDEMQDYLSTVMGAKGNEVSLAMYDVKLFKEKNYFPLKSAHQYMAKAKEQAQGEVKIKNSGFSKETKPHAKNPIVLSSFMDVWSNHVNDMSMYHAFVLPMEDFYRIYNYTTPSKDENMPTEGVNASIENAYGIGATGYIEQMLKDLNGGARSDSRTGFINKMMGKFKKGAVFASASVVVQQPSAIARAAALVDTKYFIGTKVDHKRHKALWEEVKQYAPVAIIKEMGYFDTNMGKSTKDFIQGKEYSGIKEKAKALVKDSGYRDEVLSKAPALADEMAWCSIWEAVKRETKAKNPGMNVNSDEFLTKAGERFTEVITKTQVYDSVLSRSANMRSKDTGMQMATAFMAEPTTSINMIADALLKGKRGNRKYARAAIGSVIASQILNSFLVAWVYAARDDDEDESYAEKYLSSFVSGIVDGINPLTYIPFIKDFVSIVQGYDVERSDMSVFSDFWKAYKNLTNDKVSAWNKVEGFVGSICQIFGLPVKNIMRDVRSVYQMYNTLVNGEKTTGAGIGYAIKGAITGQTVSDQQQLYKAILSGDNAQIARVKGRFKDQSAINSAIRMALRENDPRIRAAAEARFHGNLSEYTRIAKEIIGEKHFVQDDVVAAINAEINTMDKGDSSSGTQKASGLYKTEDFSIAVSKGDSAMANAIKTDIIQTAQKNGKTAEEAEKNFHSSASGVCKELFLEGKISESKAVDALVAYCGVDQEDAEERVGEWAFQREYGFAWSDRTDAYISGEISASELRQILMDVDGKTEEEADLQIQAYDWQADGYEGATAAAVKNYNKYCASAGVPKDFYLYIRKVSDNTENDVDANGKTIRYTAMKKIMAEIGAQAITSAQKYAIARSLGWAEYNIQKYKTW